MNRFARWLLSAILLGSVTCCSAMDEPAGGAEGKIAGDLKKMIEELANRNSPPRIVSLGRAERVPLFVTEFDFDEQSRAKDAFEAFFKQHGNTLWPLLLEYEDDNRYVITVEGDGFAQNLTIGKVCNRIARGDLLYAYMKYAPTPPKVETGGQFWSLWAPSSELKAGLKEFSRNHGEKPLWELQIEMCEWAMTKAPALEKISAEQRAKFVEQVSKEIARLKKSHEPAVIRGAFSGEFYVTFDRKAARRVRERYEKQQSRNTD